MIMRKTLVTLALLIFFSGVVSAQQHENRRITLKNVGLDSLKKVLESRTDFKLYYVADPSEPPVISVDAPIPSLAASLNKSLLPAGYTLSQVGNTLYILKKMGIMTKLPDSFFTPDEAEEESDAAYVEAISYTENTAASENKVYRIGDPNVPFKGSKAVITGYVKDLNTGEPVPDVLIKVESTKTTAVTNLYGFYRILAPTDKVNLILKASNMEDARIMLEVYGNGELEVLMKEKVHSLQNITVTAEGNQQRRTPLMGVEKLQINKIKHIPTAFGEADVMKVILTLPGVKSVGESSSGFNVRGGATDQNLILFNDGTIYNPTHLFGLFSAFNPDVVSDVELYKSSIPAKYGGRISSVLEINNRNGNSKKITGSAGIGLLTSKFHLEGPIVKNRTNFILGARTTYSDWMLNLLPDDSGYKGGSAYFYDITAGLSHKINKSNTIYAYGYYSADGFSFSRDTSYSYKNLSTSLKWHSVFSEKHSLTLSLGYDSYTNDIKDKGSEANTVNAFDMRFNIEQCYLKANFDWMINEKHSLNYGLNATYFRLSPGILEPVGSQSEVSPTILDKENAVEAALFVSDKWTISDNLSLDAGIRFTFYSAMGPASYYKYQGGDMSQASITDSVAVGSGKFVKPYYGPEFRLSARYFITDNLTVKAGFNTMRQGIHMLSNTASASPVDTWKLSDANIVPQTGWQAAGGIYYSLFSDRLELSLEGYYKRMQHYLDYKSGAVLSMNPHIEWDVLETEGKAYGLEFMLKKPLGKLNGWATYSYSRTLLRESADKEVYEINNGRWYPASYDKPHDVKVVLNYKFTQRYSISANVDYATGRPVTLPVSKYYYAGGYRLEYSDRNSYRIPDYFRLDLAFNIEPSHNLKLWTHSVITFGVYNVTGRKNAYSVYYTTSNGTKIQGNQLSIFGAPIPYINYTIKF